MFFVCHGCYNINRLILLFFLNVLKSIGYLAPPAPLKSYFVVEPQRAQIWEGRSVAEKVIYLEDSEDLRSLMSHLIKSRLGEDCLCLASVKDLIKAEKIALNSKIIILDINLGAGEPTGLDAFDWLQEQGFKGKIFFLTGHAYSHPLVAKACASGAEVWNKPILTNKIFPALRQNLDLPKYSQ